MLFGEIITSKGLKIVMTRGENRKQRAEQYWLKEDRVRKKKTGILLNFYIVYLRKKHLSNIVLVLESWPVCTMCLRVSLSVLYIFVIVFSGKGQY